ncbi:hypothetical protein LWI28_012091 [Acer negundo]|uniref:Uncharacterized protein n=1 Tax=Acer negundo TaxID=4023 RepID=A0AAD5IED6_ACENE|nr:hypothetical protein LWI28_012091 [Acer negundo]
MISRSILSLFLALVIRPMLATGASKGSLVGGWSPIKDLSDPQVKEIAVAESNKQSQAGLVLKSPVSGNRRDSSGFGVKLPAHGSGGKGADDKPLRGRAEKSPGKSTNGTRIQDNHPQPLATGSVYIQLVREVELQPMVVEERTFGDCVRDFPIIEASAKRAEVDRVERGSGL